jgi:pimeloyl-ACP methyl ester carboxylesterase
VRSLTLVDPGGIAPLRLGRFLLWGTASLVASLLPGRLRSAAGRALRMPALDDKRLLRWAFYGQRHHRVRLLPTDPLTDDQLRSIAAPVLRLVGEKTEVHDGRAVVARACDLLPDIEAEMVAGAGHGLPISHIDHVVARMTAFLAAHDVTSPSGGRDVP